MFVASTSKIVLPTFSFPGQIWDRVSLNLGSLLAPNIHENRIQNVLQINLISAVMFERVLDRFCRPCTSHLFSKIAPVGHSSAPLSAKIANNSTHGPSSARLWPHPGACRRQDGSSSHKMSLKTPKHGPQDTQT